MKINGVPVHPLLVHGAVVFVPMAALLVAAYVLPKYRWAARWPALVLTVLATAFVQLSAMSGEDLEHQLGESKLIQAHAEWAGRLQFCTWVLLVVMVVAFWALPHQTRLNGAEHKPARIPALEKPMMVVLPVLALAVLVLVVITGDAGARAVWAGSGG